MNTIWYKVWFDLWHNKIRTLLVTLSIAVGVFAIGAIFGMVDQQLSTMDAAHQSISPSHVYMFLAEHIDRDMAKRLETIPGLTAIEPLNSISVRYKEQPAGDWSSGILFMRDSYTEQTYDILHLKDGLWPDGNNIGVERLSSDFFGFGLGDELIFELDQTDRAFAITGKIRHPFVEPPSFGGEAVFFIDAEGAQRFQVPKGKFDTLLIQVDPYSADFAKSVASEIKDRLAKERIGVAMTFFQDPSEHWGRSILEGLNFVMQIMAVVALFMSVILVTNTLTALITQQIDQIGVMKAIGGTRGVIIKTYLSGVFAYSLLALCISLPLGAVMAFMMTKWFLAVFNIDYPNFQYSTRALLMQMGTALLIPPLAALLPVMAGAATTIRAAMANYGIQDSFGSNRLDRFVQWLGERLLNPPFAIAIGNMFRQKRRLLLTQLVLVVAGATFLMVMSLSNSLMFTLDNDIDRRGFDIRISFEEDQRRSRIERMADSVDGVAESEIWYVSPASILQEGQRIREAGIGAELVGIPNGSTMYRPLVTVGRWFEPNDQNVIVINQTIAEDNEIGIGDVVTLDLGALGDAEWSVIGIAPVVIDTGFSADSIYAPWTAVAQETKRHKWGTRLLVKTAASSPAQVQQINAELHTAFNERQMDIDLFKSGTISEDRTFAISQFGVLTTMFLSLAMTLALVGGIGLMGALSISVIERVKEIGIMKAIGARSRTIMGMFVMESVLQGIVSWMIAVPLSFILTKPLSERLGNVLFDAKLDFQYSYLALGIWLVAILAVSVLASIIPARRATQISVRESLNYT